MSALNEWFPDINDEDYYTWLKENDPEEYNYKFNQENSKESREEFLKRIKKEVDLEVFGKELKE